MNDIPLIRVFGKLALDMREFVALLPDGNLLLRGGARIRLRSSGVWPSSPFASSARPALPPPDGANEPELDSGVVFPRGWSSFASDEPLSSLVTRHS